MKLAGIIVVLMILVGCNHQDSKPNDVIDASVMPFILSDIFKTEGMIAFMQQDTCVNKGLIFDSIYLKYNTDSATFQRSLNYYSKDLDRYAQLYDSAYSIIKKEQENLMIIINNK